jgi:hypothetical protein
MAAALVGAAAIALSGCAYTMGEFAQSERQPAPVADAAQTGAIPIKPATYVVDTTATPPANVPVPRVVAPAAPAGVATTEAAYPNINAVPLPPKSKLLTPEEKAKVIAELEALAKGQEAAMDKTRKAAATKCDAAVQKTLDPEAKLKSEVAGQGC